jgi:hypothetical protein
MATQGNGEFERWLERELRRTVATEGAPSPLAAQAAYRDGSPRGGKLSVIRAGIAGKAVAGLAAAALTVGAGSAVAMATTGSHSPVELVQNIAGLVAGCNDQEGDAGMRAPGSQASGRCRGSEGNQNLNMTTQQANGTRVSIPSQSPSPGKHEDHGQGNGGGSAQAPGQGNRGNDNGHKPSPKPHP